MYGDWENWWFIVVFGWLLVSITRALTGGHGFEGKRKTYHESVMCVDFTLVYHLFIETSREFLLSGF
jgi:hypothetical protein